MLTNTYMTTTMFRLILTEKGWLMITYMTMTTTMITDMTTTTDTTTTTDMTTIMITEDAAATTVRPMITANTNWRITMQHIPMKDMQRAIRTPAPVRNAIPMKSIAIFAGKAWHTANAVCRMLRM